MYLKNNASPVRISFDFAATTDFFSEHYMWDYYTHSPSDWTLKLYSGLGGTGTELIDFDFSFTPGAHPFSTVSAHDFTDVLGALSGVTETRSNSPNGGVGLAVFGFVTFSPPPPPRQSQLQRCYWASAGSR